MKRLLAVLLVLTILVGVLPAAAQEGPTGTFLGTWPYILPPNHHFNGFATGGPGDNLGAVYRSLVELTPAFYMWAEGEYEPLLAESWGFTDDNSAYFITLNDEAMWSNGTPVTADDVIATYALGRIIGWSQFTYINDVVKVDDHTVNFVFSSEPSLLAERLLLKEYIVSNETYGELAQEALDLIASGAASDSEEWTALKTKITEFRPEQYLATGPYTYTLDDVNDAYLTLKWQPNSLFSDDVQFGEIRLWAGETETTAPLILSGELAHSTNVYPASSVEAFEAQGIRMITLPRGYGVALLMNHDVYPFNIKEVRQAMAHAINREENAFITAGFGAEAPKYSAGIYALTESLLNQEDIDALNPYEYDLDKAAALMEQAGFTRNADGKWEDAEGKTITVEYKFPSEFVDFSGAAQNATEQLNSFGFDITLRGMQPFGEVVTAIRSGDFQLSVWSYGAASPFASRHFFGPTQRFNYPETVKIDPNFKGMNFPMEFEYNGEQIDLNTMINEASTGLDVEAQKERAGVVARIINDVLPFIPLNDLIGIEPFNEDLIGGAPADDDPILANPAGSGDHYIIWGILQGTLFPQGAAADMMSGS